MASPRATLPVAVSHRRVIVPTRRQRRRDEVQYDALASRVADPTGSVLGGHARLVFGRSMAALWIKQGGDLVAQITEAVVRTLHSLVSKYLRSRIGQ